MSYFSDARFAEMMTTKFCHDIAGPVGAIANGVEFLADADADMHEQAIKLIANSSTEASVRLQFYRHAYGVNSSDAAVNLGDTRKLVVDFFNQAKPELVWPVGLVENLSIGVTSLQRKIALNLMIVAIAALPRGGQVEFLAGDNFLSVTARGEAIKFGQIEQEFLGGQKTVEDIDSRNVQLYYCFCLIKQSENRFAVDLAEKSVTFKLSI